MANFELQVNSRAFKSLGVELDFDENRYGTLLDELVATPPVSEIPVLNIDKAPVWGMPTGRKILADFAQNYEIYPTNKYNETTKTLSLRVDKDEKLANKLLLNATRRWAADLNGELAESKAYDHRRRLIRRGLLVGPTATGAVAGLELGDGIGALMGGMAGLIGGIMAETVDIRRTPYRKAVREFTKNQEVLAEYGQIINFKAA